MGQSSNKVVKRKKDEEKVIEVDKNSKLYKTYDKLLIDKKLKEEKEKDEILKINKKWENEEKEQIIKIINNIDNKKKITLNKIEINKDIKIRNLKQKNEEEKKVPEIKIEIREEKEEKKVPEIKIEIKEEKKEEKKEEIKIEIKKEIKEEKKEIKEEKKEFKEEKKEERKLPEIKIEIKKEIKEEKKEPNVEKENKIEERKKEETFIPKIKLEINKNQYDSNLTEQEMSLKNKLNSIEEKATLFLDGKINDLIQKFNYTLEVNKYISEEINYLKNNYPDQLIEPKEAISELNYIVNFLGYLGSELSLYRIRTLIEKAPSNELIRDITFKIILGGLATQRVYKIIVQSEKEKNKFRENIQFWDEFLQSIIKKIVKAFRVEKNEVLIFNKDITNFEFMMIIHNKRLNGVDQTLKNLGLNVSTGNLLNNIILSPNMFETKYCKDKNDWFKGNKMRGGERYNPPNGWTGFAIKLRNKFGCDFEWLGNTGERGKEWCVAFHGIGRGDELIKAFSILNTNLRAGPKQRYCTYKNIRKFSKDEFKKCGRGVYLTPEIKKAEHYAHKTKLGYNDKEFQFAVQTRVNPSKIRDPGVHPINWILNGSSQEIRPYRLLVKYS